MQNRRRRRTGLAPFYPSYHGACNDQLQDWAKRFLTGAAVASLVMIAGTVMMVLVRAVWNPVVRLA
jgi:hypothetical protein